MRALRVTNAEETSPVSLRDIDALEPGDGEVLVAVKAAGISRVDLGMISHARANNFQVTPGRDYAGVVVRGDPNWIGKEVWGSGAGFGSNRDGAQAEFLVLPAAWLSEKPSNLSLTDAALVGIPYLTAWQALVRAAKVVKDEWVLVTGARGSVGWAAIQIAHWRKALVIGVDRSAGPSAADVSINTQQSNVVDEVMTITSGKGANVVLDSVGGELFEPCLRSLARAGRQIAIASPSQPRVEFDLVEFFHKEAWLGGVSSIDMGGEEIALVFDQLRDGFESGHLKVPQVTSTRLEDARDAYDGAAERPGYWKGVLSIP
jgi:NADPH:quinone reductase